MNELCEVCGKREARMLVYIEGAKLNVCSGCGGSGKVLSSFEQGSSEPTKKRSGIPRSLKEEERIIDGYGKTVKDAREKKGLKREELGKQINEMESFIEKIEKEKTMPPMKTAKKLENALGIKLIEKVSTDIMGDSNFNKSSKKELTLADMIEEED